MVATFGDGGSSAGNGGGSLGSASVEVRATVSKLRADMRASEGVVRQSMDGITRNARATEGRLRSVGASFRREMLSSAASVDRVNSSLSGMQGLLVSIGGAFAAQEIVRMADQYTNLAARIRLVARAGEDLAEIQEALFNIAQRMRAPLNEMVGLYVRIRQATGAADAEARTMVETLAQTLTISGANAAEAASFMTQIGQALGEGYLRAEELNTVLSTNPRFVRLLADYLGVATSEIRKLSREGRITTDVLRGAATQGAGQLAEEMASIPLTVGGALQQIRNALVRYVGETDQGLGASRRLAEGLSVLASNFKSVADAILLVGAAGATVLGGRALQGAVRAGVAAARDADAPYRQNMLSMIARRENDLQWTSEFEARNMNRERVIALRRERMADARARMAEAVASAEERAAQRIQRAENIAQLRQERINQIRAARARRMFNIDGGAIERALRENRDPVLRPEGDAAGPIRIGGANALTESQRMEREQRKISALRWQINNMRMASAASADYARAQADLEKQERALQRIRADSYRPATEYLQAQNRLTWATRNIAAQNGLWAQSMRVVQAGAVGMGRVMGSLYGFLGGAWGVALTAAVAAWAWFRSEQEKAVIGAQRMESALALIATIAPPAAQATSEAADEATRLAEAAEGARDLTEAERLAGQAAAALARNQEQAARATDLRAQAQRGLAAAQERSARATLQEALAESRRIQREAPSTLSALEATRTDLRARMDYAPSDYLRRRIAEADQALADAQANIEAARRDEPLFRGAIDAMNSGFTFGGSAGSEGGAGGGGGAGGDGRNRLGELRAQAELSLARLRNEHARVAVLEDALEVEKRTAAYVEAGLSSDQARAAALREVTAEREAISAQQRESLELSTLQHQADMERSRGNVLTAEALEDELETRRLIQELTLDGMEAEEAARVAAERVQDQRAQREIDRAREVALRRLEFLREIAEAEGNGTRVADLDRQIAAIRIARELRDMGAAETDGEASKQAEWELSEVARARVRGQIRQAVSDGLYEAVTGGDWREAFADALERFARRAFDRAADALMDAISGMTSGGGGGGWLGSIVSAFAGVAGGGGKVSLPTGKVSLPTGKVQIDPVSFPGAKHSGHEGARMEANKPRPVTLKVEARTDGSVDLKISQAEQRATIEGGKLGAQIIAQTLKARSSV